jgi:hypothetical protein
MGSDVDGDEPRGDEARQGRVQVGSSAEGDVAELLCLEMSRFLTT